MKKTIVAILIAVSAPAFAQSDMCSQESLRAQFQDWKKQLEIDSRNAQSALARASGSYNPTRPDLNSQVDESFKELAFLPSKSLEKSLKETMKFCEMTQRSQK